MEQTRTLTPAHKRKISRKLKKHEVSEETREKISQALLGNTNRIGKRQSEATRRKIARKVRARTTDK
jgi:hypothetical protein